MNVLMVGLDDAVFLGDNGPGNTAVRLRRYLETMRRAEPDSTLTYLVFTRERHRPLSLGDGLWFVPVRALRLQLFPWAGLWTIWPLRPCLQPDVITTQDPLEAGLLGLMLKRVFRASLEVQIHFNLLSPYWRAEHRRWNRVRQLLARFVLTHADAIRVVSSPLKHMLMETWGIPEERMAVLPVPVFYESQPETPGLADPQVLSGLHRRVVLFVGRFYYPKNLPGLFTVIERVLHASPDVEFVLVGDGPERPYATGRAAALDRQRIHVVGYAPYTDLAHYYRRADVLVLPSLYEGFGRVVLEGYLFDTPAVATRCGGPEDIIVDGETGFLTGIEDMEGFADRVLWLLNHPGVARQMGERGHVYVQRAFEPEGLIEQMVGQWRRMYSSALAAVETDETAIHT